MAFFSFFVPQRHASMLPENFSNPSAVLSAFFRVHHGLTPTAEPKFDAVSFPLRALNQAGVPC